MKRHNFPERKKKRRARALIRLQANINDPKYFERSKAYRNTLYEIDELEADIGEPLTPERREAMITLAWDKWEEKTKKHLEYLENL